MAFERASFHLQVSDPAEKKIVCYRVSGTEGDSTLTVTADNETKEYVCIGIPREALCDFLISFTESQSAHFMLEELLEDYLATYIDRKSVSDSL